MVPDDTDTLAHDGQKTEVGTIPASWACRQIKDLVKDGRKVTYGIVQPGEHDPDGVLLIRGQDYIGGWAGPDAFFRVSPELDETYRRSRTVAGDILLCIVGYTGEVNQVPDWIDEANITQTTARIACDENEVVSGYMLYFLASGVGRKQTVRLMPS